VVEFAIVILQMLLNNKGDIFHLQNDLLDLCGVDMFEEITEIIKNRDELVSSYKVLNLID